MKKNGFKPQLTALGFMMIIGFLGVNLYGQEWDDLHGRQYRANHQNTRGNPFYHEKQLEGNVIWQSTKFEEVPFYYEMEKDALIVRKNVNNQSFLIEVPTAHIHSFEVNQSRFINTDYIESVPRNLATGFFEVIQFNDGYRFMLKHDLEVTTFANKATYSPHHFALIQLDNHWFSVESNQDLHQLCEQSDLPYKTLTNELPKLKKCRVADWYLLAERIKQIQ